MNEEQEKKITVWLKLSQADKDLLNEKAAKCRMSLSQYVMFLAESRPIFVVDALPQFIAELNKVGSNINQIAHVANTQKFLSPESLKLLRENQRAVEDIGRGINEILNTMNNPAARSDGQKFSEQKFSEDLQMVIEMRGQLELLIQKMTAAGSG